MQSLFLAASDDSGSPVMTIMLFVLVLVGAAGYFIYTENQKRSDVRPGQKVSRQALNRRMHTQRQSSQRGRRADRG